MTACRCDLSNFNCTIQELKLCTRLRSYWYASFQLHHTGIKTTEGFVGIVFLSTFQLHHTGIKT